MFPFTLVTLVFKEIDCGKQLSEQSDPTQVKPSDQAGVGEVANNNMKMPRIISK